MASKDTVIGIGSAGSVGEGAVSLFPWTTRMPARSRCVDQLGSGSSGAARAVALASQSRGCRRREGHGGACRRLFGWCTGVQPPAAGVAAGVAHDADWRG